MILLIESKRGQRKLSSFHKKQLYIKNHLLFRIESCMMKTRNSERSKITSQADRKGISMKKQKLCALLCAAMMLASSLPAFAANPVLEEPPVEAPVQSESDLFTEKLLTATIRVIDQKGNPVPGLVSDSDLVLFPTTDGYGKSQVEFATVSLPSYKLIEQVNTFVLKNPISGESMTCSARSFKEGGEYTFIWKKETPAQSIEKVEDKVTFCAVDQNGNPIKNVEFSFSDQRYILPTNEDGKTYCLHGPLKQYYVNVEYVNKEGKKVSQKFFPKFSEDDLKNHKQYTFKLTV